MTRLAQYGNSGDPGSTDLLRLSDSWNPRYKITFYERSDTGKRVSAWLGGDSPPTPSQGGGGFTIVDLPMRSSVTVWTGRTGLLLMDIPIILYDEHSIASALSVLTNMWRPNDATIAPPVIRISARGDAVPFTHKPWVFNDLTWGGAIGDEHANKTAQMMTVQLMEYVEDEVLQTTKLKTHSTGSVRTYVVKSGDTLTAIAKRYRLTNGWRSIASIQTPPITDPRTLKVGTKLRIPAS